MTGSPALGPQRGSFAVPPEIAYFNTATLSHIAQLHSAVSARKLARLYAGNVIAIVGTCGLLIPWAVVRVTRYRLQCITMEIEAPQDAVAAAVAQVPAATGEELPAIYPAATYQRLAEVKDRYDPENLFAGNHNVRPGHAEQTMTG